MPLEMLDPGKYLSSGSMVVASTLVRLPHVNVVKIDDRVWVPIEGWMRWGTEGDFRSMRHYIRAHGLPTAVLEYPEAFVSVSVLREDSYLEVSELPGWQFYVPGVYEVLQSMA